jgi:hypothetical protein
MRKSWFWALFAVCSVGWLSASLAVAPSMSGEDVYIFRDAGWNLAAYGSFESAALVYSTDLTPRLNSHYTPVQPLLFAGYASIFPRNAYAGTVFNHLVGVLAAAVALALVLRQPAGGVRNLAAFALAALPVAFISYDRPEAIALVLFSATAWFAARPNPRPVLVGLLISATFLAHPFAAVAAAVWVSAFFLLHNWPGPHRWLRTVSQVAIAGVISMVPLAAVAAVYYSLDRNSLARFAAHSLGRASGIHAAESGGWLTAIRKAAFGLSAMGTFNYLASLASVFLLIGWAIARRKELAIADMLPVAAGVACTLAALFLFSIQGNYIVLLSVLVPAGLLAVSSSSSKLAAPAMALLLFAVLIRLPETAMSMLQRIEQTPSYLAARTQPAFLRAQLAAPDPVVAVEGDSYDLFKPQFRRVIRLDYVQDRDQYRSLAAVANCYDAYHDPSRPDKGGVAQGSPVRPLSPKLNPADFHLIQPDPQHMWITLMGKRLMRAQWGYGCDLYVRNGASPEENNSNGMRVNE